jgi:hypothetical protein
MNYRLQLSPISDIRESQEELLSRERRKRRRNIWENARFYRTWALYDYNMEPRRAELDWNMVLGLGLALAISVGLWVAIGTTVASLWR